MGVNCTICGEPMPKGEEMFKFHGYSGNCPKPPLPRPTLEDRALHAALEISNIVPGVYDHHIKEITEVILKTLKGE